MYSGIIYCATSPSNKKYYGKTVELFKKRIKRHLCNSESSLCHFSTAIRKYGIENFNWKIIEVLESESPIDLRKKLNERERYWIKTEKTYDREIGYNMTLGGDGGAEFGRSLSKETKLQIQKSLTGRKYSEERRNNMSTGSLGISRGKGKPKSEEHRKNMSQPRSEEHRNNMRKPKSEEHRRNMMGRIAWNKGKSNAKKEFKY